MLVKKATEAPPAPKLKHADHPFDDITSRMFMTEDQLKEKMKAAGVEPDPATNGLTEQQMAKLEAFVEAEAAQPEPEPEPEPEPAKPTPAPVPAAKRVEPLPEPEAIAPAAAVMAPVARPQSDLTKIIVLASFGFAFFALVFAVATLMLLRNQPTGKVVETKIIEKAAPLVLPKEESKTGDFEMLRLLWKMADGGFYKSAHEIAERFKKEYPESKYLEDVLYKQAEVLYNWDRAPAKVRFDPVVEAANNAVATFPQSAKAPWAVGLRGDAYAALKVYDKALDSYREVIRTYPDYGHLDQIQYNVGESFLSMGKYADAEKEYLRVLSKFPSTDLKNRVYFKVSVALEKQKRFDDAQLAYRRFLKMFPDDANKDEAMFALASIYFEQNDFVQAADAFRKTIGRYPYDTFNDRALYMIAQCHAKQGDHKSARKVLDELVYSYKDSPYVPNVYFKMGDYYFESGNVDQAVKFYEKAIEKYPTHELVRPTVMMLADIYLSTKQYDRAISFYRDRLTKHPDATVDDKLYFMLAKAYYGKGIYIAAVNALDKINLQPSQSKLDEAQVKEAYHLKAEAYFAAELYGEAKESYMRYINTFPQDENNDYYYYQLGIACFRLGQFEEAVNTLRVGMEKYPLSKYRYKSRYMIAKTYRASNDTEKAVDNLERLVSNEYLKGRDVYFDACIDLAELYAERSNIDRASQLLDDVINTDTDETRFLRAVKVKGTVLAASGAVDKLLLTYENVVKGLMAKDAFSEVDAAKKNERIADMYAAAGDALFKARRFKEALPYYDKSFKTYKAYSKADWVLYQTGNCHTEQSDYKQADVFYSFLKKEYPDSYWTRQLAWTEKHIGARKEVLAPADGGAR
jgi:TolA-binding protein